MYESCKRHLVLPSELLAVAVNVDLVDSSIKCIAPSIKHNHVAIIKILSLIPCVRRRDAIFV